MDLDNYLSEYKMPIVAAGLIIGALKVLDFLPNEFSLLGSYTKYAYLAIIGLAGYTFFTLYQGHTHSASAGSFARTVAARSLSSPEHLKDIAKQRGSTSNEILNKFNRD